MAGPVGWVRFKEVSSSIEAQTLKTYLEQNGVPTFLENLGELPGLEKGVVLAVPEHLLHRARWLIADKGFTDDELSFLATGELPGKH